MSCRLVYYAIKKRTKFDSGLERQKIPSCRRFVKYPTPSQGFKLKAFQYSIRMLHHQATENTMISLACFTSQIDWSGNLPPLFQPIRFKTETNRHQVTNISRASGTSRHFFNQSDLKLKPIATLSLPFSRAPGSLLIVKLNSHWFLVISSFVLIFTTIIKCTLYQSSLQTSSSPAVGERELQYLYKLTSIAFHSTQ